MRVLVVISAIFAYAQAANVMKDRCTAILVGAKASATGAPMTTHSNDCDVCDFRLVKVPGRQHDTNATRPIFKFSSQYPRYVGTDRGPGYAPDLLDDRFYNWPATEPIGSIPQVAFTFGYLDGVYGIMNEHQLAMGESTCGGRFAARPVSDGGHALFDITELGRLALERTTNARDAIMLMGEMAEVFGYYGAGWDSPTEDEARQSSGEALTITDTHEAWMFHILPDDTGASAVWAAQQLAPDHVSVVANEFVIRTIDFADSTTFMYSSTMQEVAKRSGFWDDGTPFDFTAIFAYTGASTAYATRRVWRVLTLANPQLALNPYTDIYASDYPFSVAPAAPLAAADLMMMHRDHYEGTEFDLTQGPAAGPYGDPTRYSVDHAGGRFERAIGVDRTTYSFVATPNANRTNLGVLWFGPYAADWTTYIPVYAAVSNVPATLSQGSHRSFALNSTFWLHTLLGNYASRFYQFTRPVVLAAQRAFEADAADTLIDVETIASTMATFQGDAAMISYLTTTADIMASQAHESMTVLMGSIVTRFHDGYVVSGATHALLTVADMGYPDWYLKSVGYFDPLNGASVSTVTALLFVVLVVIVAVSVGLGFYVGRVRAQAKKRGYVFIQ